MSLPKKSETQVYPISIGRCLANTQSLKASNGIRGTTVAICSQSPEIENGPSKAHVPGDRADDSSENFDHRSRIERGWKGLFSAPRNAGQKEDPRGLIAPRTVRYIPSKNCGMATPQKNAATIFSFIDRAYILPRPYPLAPQDSLVH